MGKPFDEEFGLLKDTYENAANTNITTLSEFVKKSAWREMYIVGSGGSATCAVFASMLHQHTGNIAKHVTPLEFVCYPRISERCAVLIVSAGGNNNDVMAAFKRAVQSRPGTLGVLCASSNNRLVRAAAGVPGVFMHAADTPAGKDGFLATNSTLAVMVWLLRAYSPVLRTPAALPPFDRISALNNVSAGLEEFRDCTSVLFLHDNWTAAAACDAESKMSEAGLCCVQPADYRNFGHGLHNWLDKNRGTSGIIAMSGRKCQKLAEDTLGLVPDCIPRVSLYTESDGPDSAITALLGVMSIVSFFGGVRGIDPGRPGVAKFGKELYRLPIPDHIISSSYSIQKAS